MFFVLPSGVIRALGGWFADKWGGDTVTWWVFWVSIICLFFLAYPPTTVTIHRINEDLTFNIATGVVAFTALVFVIGIAQGIGKASVYRSLADHYTGNMGPVGGLVGVIGGLGGFSLPYPVWYRTRRNRGSQHHIHADVRDTGRCNDLDLDGSQRASVQKSSQEDRAYAKRWSKKNWPDRWPLPVAG